MSEQPSRVNRPSPNKTRRELLLGAGAFVGFLVLSALLLTILNPGLRASLLTPKANAPIEIVVAHTNDTWGYTKPCG